MIRIIVTALALSLAGASSEPVQDHNPLFPGADPDMITACGAWWIYPTTQGAGGGGPSISRFYAWRSDDLRHWRRIEKPILDIDDIAWIKADGAPSHHLWAPSLTEANGRYYLYYSVGPQNPTPSRIGVAVADTPQGPFVDNGKPLLTGGNGFEAIDPMVFTDPRTGRSYLYAGGSAGSTLRVFEMAPNMVSLAREIAVPTPQNFTEGSFMHERNGIYYLSYSHGRYNGPDYSVHYATGPSPIGPFTYRGAILTSDGTHQGPGHHAFVRDPVSGQWYIAYHRWERTDATPPFRGAREVAIEAITYDGNGLIAPIAMTNGQPPLRSLRGKRGKTAGHCN
jgi:beta-xylosidase